MRPERAKRKLPNDEIIIDDVLLHVQPMTHYHISREDWFLTCD